MKRRLTMKQPRKNGDKNARSALLAAARGLFARRGLSGTSIRDIAQAAKLNSSLISYYFESKEGLYRACIEEIAANSLAMTQRVLKPADSEPEYRLRLQMFLDEIFTLFLEDRDTGLILVREYDRLHSPAEQVFRDSLIQVMNALVQFFKHAQEKGIVDKDKDPLTLASLLFGCVISQMRMDHIQEKAFKKSLLDPQEKRKVENHIVDLFLIPPKNKK